MRYVGKYGTAGQTTDGSMVVRIECWTPKATHTHTNTQKKNTHTQKHTQKHIQKHTQTHTHTHNM
jgi:hypothetical protein